MARLIDLAGYVVFAQLTLWVLLASLSFLMYGNGCIWAWYSNDFSLTVGRLYKRRSSLGRFLNAPLHYTKNTLLSQGVAPL
ncbi:hypothetical protein [Dysgonomonas sp. ZJ279]|uniref:hypothetical protein n=1 Tax=Dysgonomonas sp. ZJ279 TaxID=2709796 RepID=UPI0013ED0A56|nr:hypothetical protein [Dysgonomonas sp. ZJ279]